MTCASTRRAVRLRVCVQKQLASERIAALLEDRRIREYEEAAHRTYMDQQV